MPTFYPPASFYFTLSFSGISTSVDAAFQEVSGISSDVNIQEVTCGGENRFTFKLPGTVKYENLNLKRGFVAAGSQVGKWCAGILSGNLDNPITTKTIVVSLLNAKGKPLSKWTFNQAYPIKWGVSEFKSMENTYVIESLAIAYTNFTQSS